MKRNSERFDNEEIINETEEKNNFESKQKFIKEGKENIKAYLRIRPIETEMGNFFLNSIGPYKVCDQDDKQLIVHVEGKTQTFKFNQIFNKDNTQHDIYFNIVQPLVNDLIDNKKSSLLFSFGNTNSGKTFTISGNATNPGILPNSLSQIFKFKKNDSDVILNCIEIYNENVYDIFHNINSQSEKKKVELKLNSKRSYFYIKGKFYLN